MIGRRNYWHVYNHIRRRVMDTGKQPERADLLAEFSDLEPAEVDEGIAEYEITFGEREGGGGDAQDEE
ncbi:hypothetical protein J2Z22_001618 [Paenibacillus forsythiae]|uniref:Uncharacterized protein n=1 Tax=Paenibacillus forsythiae TaxID=365616 RepID=A0ABU3H5K1_9BACL|nr:hypothetical protein [Paenibacillus forsythiae]MDT3426098.1 hypothetical protein [Paenibacillus forsythiae]